MDSEGFTRFVCEARFGGVDKLTRISMLACVIKSILLTTFKCVPNYSSLALPLAPAAGDGLLRSSEL